MKCIVLVVLCLAYAEAGAIPSGSRDPSSEQAGGKCEPGTIAAVDCNTCVCTEIGTLVCTEKNCNTPEAKIPVPMNALFDSVRQNRNLNTELARETRKKEEEPLKICDPEKEFRMDCNRCICDIEGLSFSCTRLDCNIHNVGRRKREPSVPGSLVDVMRVDEDMQTTPSIRRTRGVTQPTPMSKSRDLVKEALKTCQPGQEFRMDCNRCLCDSEGLDFSCTRIDCNAQNGKSRRRRDTSEQVTMECTPGSVFDVDCNVCRCTSDGHHAMCTVKRCGASTTVNNDLSAPQKKPRSYGVTDSDPNFRCNPGEQFKRDCNDCTCSADGKSVFCTVRFCDQGVTPPSSL